MADENNDQSTAPADEVLTPPLLVSEGDVASTDADTPDAETGAEAEPESTAPVTPEQAADVQPVAEAPRVETATADADSTATDTAEPETEEAVTADTAAPETEEAVTAVSLGLLPADFVSAVSTKLVFYAPTIVPLPARPGVRLDPRDDRDEGASESGTSARRRNRRRGGGSSANDDDTPREQSQPRRRAVELITEPQRIKGSTRLEAKKQRRRDGREAGRRRTDPRSPEIGPS